MCSYEFYKLKKDVIKIQEVVNDEFNNYISYQETLEFLNNDEKRLYYARRERGRIALLSHAFINLYCSLTNIYNDLLIIENDIIDSLVENEVKND